MQFSSNMDHFTAKSVDDSLEQFHIIRESDRAIVGMASLKKRQMVGYRMKYYLFEPWSGFQLTSTELLQLSNLMYKLNEHIDPKH
jgi:hypothetical protein